ncbi:MAG: hypothetical protein IJ806_05950 [Ruminococcus sp.]|nr:hypothetical protein [Ruminococcus sp.]
MKNKVCPYCGKELSPEAVLCKYCHNLLIDDDEDLDDKTKVFSKQDIEDADKTKPFKVPDSKNAMPKKKAEPVINEAPAANDAYQGGAADEGYDGDGYDGYDDYDDYGDEYEDDDLYYDEDEESKKRMFIIIAVITVAVLVVIIGAIVVGMHLFGSGSGTKNNNSKAPAQTRPISSVIVDTEDPELGSSSEDEESEGQDLAVVESTPSSETVSEAESSSEAGESADSSSEEAEDSQDNGSDDSQAADDTSSQASDSSDDGPNYVVGADDSRNTAVSSTAPETSEPDSSSSAGDSSQASGGNYESLALSAASDRMTGELVSSQFREDDGEYAYYYFFTNDGGAEHGYSVAYNKASGTAIVAQAY